MSTSTIDKLLLQVQKDLETVIKDGENPHFKSNYATFNAIVDTVKKPLNDKGILIEQVPDADEYGKFVRTALLHVESGESKSCKVYLELPKPDMQKVGSAITYAKRYGLQTLCVLPSEDDDGNGATDVATNKTNNSTSGTGGFGKKKTKINSQSTGVIKKKATKKVAKKTTSTQQKTETSQKTDESTKTGGFGRTTQQKTVTPPPENANKGGFGNKKEVTPPPTFDNKPTFGNRGAKPEPEF